MDQSELAIQIGRLESRLPNAAAAVKKSKEKVSAAKRGRVVGVALLGIAAVGLAAVFSWWLVWALVGMIGALTLVRAIADLSHATKEQDRQQSSLTQSRSTVAEWRASFAAAQGFPQTIPAALSPLHTSSAR